MKVILRVLDDTQEFFTFNSEEEAAHALKDKEYEDAEFLVNIADLKNYREKYEEIYNLLFSNIAKTDRKVKDLQHEEIIISVKYSYGKFQNQCIKTFIDLQDASSFIEENSSDDFQAEMLVNISEVLDYKEKYDEFYKIMLNKYTSENITNKNIL